MLDQYNAPPPTPSFMPSAPPTPPPTPTMEDILNRLVRIETRLVRLLANMGYDSHGEPRRKR